MSTLEESPRGSRVPWTPVAVFGVLVVGLLVWAKWQPSWVKVPSVAGSHSLGSSILTGRAPAPPGVSITAGLSFAGTYFLAIWPALVAGLVIAAAVRTLVPTDWVARTFGAGGAGAVSLPSLHMVRRVFPARLLVAVTVLVAVVGALSAAAAAGVGL